MNNKPLSGIRVLELSNYLAAPICSRLMADWGADVIKVEAMTKDPQRLFGSIMQMPVKRDENPSWEIVNANKRGIVVDVKSSEGREIIHKLLAQADVFLTNTRNEALVKLKLDYESIKEKYPKLVYAHVTGYGNKGPDVNEPGFDYTVFWSRSGFLLDLAEPGRNPVYPPGGMGDTITGSLLFGGVCAALLNSQRTGKGDKIDISLYGTAIWSMGHQITCSQERYGYKYPRARIEANPTSTSYKCKDGEWVSFTILDYDRQWPKLCKALGIEHMINDKRFNRLSEMVKHKKELLPILEELFATKDSGEWCKSLKESDIVHITLGHFKNVTKDEQALVNNFIIEHTFPNGQQAKIPMPPIQSAIVGKPVQQKAPYFGEHTKEVLEELGYSSSQIEEMDTNKKISVKTP